MSEPWSHSNKGRRFPVEILSPDEVQALLATQNTRYRTPTRNLAMLVVAWRCGLRISEITGLDYKDYEKQSATLRILRAKGGKSRVVGCCSKTIEHLESWLAFRGTDPGPLFTNFSGGRIQNQGLRNSIKTWARRAGIQKRVHFHGLRHRCFFELANENTPMHVIKEIAGHASLQSTQVYISHLNPVIAVNTMKARTG